jgi:predicted nucleotidyltransferase
MLLPFRPSVAHGCVKKMINVAAIRHEMMRLIKAHAPSSLVVAVYVFGSFVRSDFKESSDIDLAFLVDEQGYKKDPFEATAPVHMVAAGTSVALGRETDVLVLNSASLEMAYEIITTGFCIFEIDPDVRLEYEIKIKGMYFDFHPFLSELRARKIANLGSLET